MKRILGTWLALMSLAACGGESTADGSSGGGSGSGGSVGAGATGGGSSGSGGASGSGGSGGVAGDGGGAPNQCTSDAECRLFSDCCTCAALGPNDPDPPSCLAACLQDSCSALGISGAMCSGGSCVAGYECNHQKVLCESLPPVCEGGYTPSVIGSCWGPCVPTSECISVTSCADCTSPQEACVRIDQQTGPSVKCVPIPQGCGGSLCECMGDSVCSAPYDTCTDLSGIKGLTCSCPNC